MKLLLDTHAFLWWTTEDPRVTPVFAEAVADPSNEVFVSAVTVWELTIKWQLGRLQLTEPPEASIPKGIAASLFVPLPVTHRHALRLGALPDIHRDPFDRMLIAQAMAEACVLVTADETLASYPVDVLW